MQNSFLSIDGQNRGSLGITPRFICSVQLSARNLTNCRAAESLHPIGLVETG